MAIVRWRPRRDGWPLGELTDLRDDFSDFFRGALTPFEGFGRGLFSGQFVPAVDVIEENDKIIVKAELPGMDKKDINLSIVDNTLTITGEKKHEAKEEKKNYFRIERSYGSFTRRVELPATVDTGKVAAQYKNGVLEVALPKKEEAKVKEIPVEVK